MRLVESRNIDHPLEDVWRSILESSDEEDPDITAVTVDQSTHTVTWYMYAPGVVTREEMAITIKVDALGYRRCRVTCTITWKAKWWAKPFEWPVAAIFKRRMPLGFDEFEADLDKRANPTEMDTPPPPTP